MSVIPFPAMPEAPRRKSTDSDGPRTLHLVPAHEHAWRLLAVEYDDGLEVRRYECSDCNDVLFR